MGVSEKTFPKGQFTLEQVDFLNRNPHYPEWRAAVSQVFAKVDPALDAEIARAGHARLVIVVAPAQLPADPSRMWTRFAGRGKRVALDLPERAEDFLPMLLTGAGAGCGPSDDCATVRGGKKGRRLHVVDRGGRRRDFAARLPCPAGGQVQLRGAGTLSEAADARSAGRGGGAAGSGTAATQRAAEADEDSRVGRRSWRRTRSWPSLRARFC